MVSFPVFSHGEIYVEGYLGGLTASSGEMSFSTATTVVTVPPRAWIKHTMPGHTDSPFLVGGVKVGTWLEKDSWLDRSGLLDCSNKTWLENFGVYLDFSYHKLDFEEQRVVSVDDLGGRAGGLFKSDGDVFTLALMFSGRLGFMKDSEVPFGRLQPYLGLGPALLITSQKPGMIIDTTGVMGGPFHASQNREYDVAPGFQVEPGIRWIFGKNLSLDISFKYRFAEPDFDYHFNPKHFVAAPGTMSLSPDYNLSSGQVGLAYHF